MESINTTVWGKIRKSLKIWLIPVVLYYCVVVLLGLAFQYAASKVGDERIDVLEIPLVYGGCGFLLFTFWIIIKRYEKIEQKPVRKRTKTIFKVFLAIYLISLSITLICKFLSHYLGG